MLKGKDRVIDWMRFNNTPYWKIFNVQRTALISESPEEEGLTIEGSINKLEAIIEVIGSGQYGLEAWETPGQKKERKKVNFEIYALSGENHPQINISGVNPENINVQEMISKALAEYKQEQELERLKATIKKLEAENKELKTEVDNVGTRIYNRLEPFLGAFMGNSNNIPAEVSGTGEINEDTQQRLEKAFDLWSQKESDVLTLVEKIAQLAHNDSTTYNMARSMLLNQK